MRGPPSVPRILFAESSLPWVHGCKRPTCRKSVAGKVRGPRWLAQACLQSYRNEVTEPGRCDSAPAVSLQPASPQRQSGGLLSGRRHWRFRSRAAVSPMRSRRSFGALWNARNFSARRRHFQVVEFHSELTKGIPNDTYQAMCSQTFKRIAACSNSYHGHCFGTKHSSWKARRSRHVVGQAPTN